ncbi:hypothetical protein LSTR_LSTR010167 [Laodelphax striatellus]|uniref:Uncharacterized protein n=1 Tax=Laodelphax striatellus TaxID=195883 RepID=A0A482WJK1_LAOST|nr:hypothetical protein LSTR_LSTR010166 [Laodelphax striatellus]RZF33511.1 hypothetical protein LSTR_LSTR010167 [Laodelphax striatellus]
MYRRRHVPVCQSPLLNNGSQKLFNRTHAILQTPPTNKQFMNFHSESPEKMNALSIIIIPLCRRDLRTEQYCVLHPPMIAA